MFTRLSNFTYGNYQIANITSAEVNTNVQFLIQIQKYEKQCLQLLLGNLLYDELMSNVELDGLYWKLKSGANEKWGWLLNGHSYTDANDSDINKTWRGIVTKVAKIEETDVFESMIAPYIFFHYALNTRTLNTGTGEARMKSDNTTQESSSNKRVDAWNEFVQWASFGFSNTNVSLYQFLEYHSDLFQDLFQVELDTMTYYGI